MTRLIRRRRFDPLTRLGWGYFWRQRSEVADLIQLYCTRVPAQVIIHNTPQDSYSSMSADQGIYVQDSWTLGRFTINPGVRFEHFNSSIEARDLGAGRFVPGRHFDRRGDLPNWNDIAPRFGFSWDVQGNGKTAGIRDQGSGISRGDWGRALMVRQAHHERLIPSP